MGRCVGHADVAELVEHDEVAGRTGSHGGKLFERARWKLRDELCGAVLRRELLWNDKNQSPPTAAPLEPRLSFGQALHEGTFAGVPCEQNRAEVDGRDLR